MLTDLNSYQQLSYHIGKSATNRPGADGCVWPCLRAGIPALEAVGDCLWVRPQHSTHGWLLTLSLQGLDIYLEHFYLGSCGFCFVFFPPLWFEDSGLWVEHIAVFLVRWMFHLLPSLSVENISLEKDSGNELDSIWLHLLHGQISWQWILRRSKLFSGYSNKQESDGLQGKNIFTIIVFSLSYLTLCAVYSWTVNRPWFVHLITQKGLLKRLQLKNTFVFI